MDNLLFEFSPEDIGTLTDLDSNSAVWVLISEDQMLRDQVMELVAERYAEILQEIEDNGDETETE